PHGLPLAMAARLCLQPADRAHEGSRTQSPRRCAPRCTNEPGHDADWLHQSRRDVHRRPEPGCGVGVGFLFLEKEPVVVQVPDFGDRFWTIPVYDARTDQISELGLPYGTKPGFYMVVGPNWKAPPRPALPGRCARPPTTPQPCRAFS